MGMREVSHPTERSTSCCAQTIWIAWLVVAACKTDDPQPQPVPQQPAIADAAPAAIDWNDQCETALRTAPKLPATRRVQAVIDGCKPCGDWTPLLAWDKQQVDGGPTRAAIEQAMLACNAYCDPNAKARFLGTLDAARGKATRGPWRLLGETCKAAVSAVPDARYMSAAFFALDRIGRAAAARQDLAPLLDAIDLPLPAISISGSGLELPTSPVTSPDLGPVALTVTATELRIAMVPHGTLGRDGVSIANKGEPYPGALVTNPKQLDAALATLVPGAASITIFAPRGMFAARLLDAIAIVGNREAKLAVAAAGGPPGWSIAGVIPVALTMMADPNTTVVKLAEDPDGAIKQALALRGTLASGVTIEITPNTRVTALARLLGAMLYFDLGSVAIRRGRP